MADPVGSTSAATNPYAAPQAAVDDAPAGEIELAGRVARLGATLLDGVFLAGIGILAAIVIPAFQRSPSMANSKTLGIILIVVMVGGFLAVIGINLWLLYTQAATIGKRLLNIRIARTDGTQPTLSRILFLRGLPMWLVGAIPLLGPVVQLVDVLFIFSQERRCLHDRIADTIVIKAPARA